VELSLPVVWSDRCLLHEPGAEMWVGVSTPATETPARAEAIRDALDARFVEAESHADDALLEVHEPELLAYLASAWDEWEETGLPEDPGQDRVVPYVFAHAALGARRPPAAVWAKLGVDAAADDPESPLQVSAVDFRKAGALLGGLGVPTVVVQEGGYDLARLGPLVRETLLGLEEGRS
jgi:acetoin utilization deacetylase AcuC-like enzyme